MNADELKSIVKAINEEIKKLDKVSGKQFKVVIKAIENGTGEEIEQAIHEHNKTESEIRGLRKALWIVMNNDKEEC